MPTANNTFPAFPAEHLSESDLLPLLTPDSVNEDGWTDESATSSSSSESEVEGGCGRCGYMSCGECAPEFCFETGPAFDALREVPGLRMVDTAILAEIALMARGTVAPCAVCQEEEIFSDVRMPISPLVQPLVSFLWRLRDETKKKRRLRCEACRRKPRPGIRVVFDAMPTFPPIFTQNPFYQNPAPVVSRVEREARRQLLRGPPRVRPSRARRQARGKMRRNGGFKRRPQGPRKR